MSQPGDLYARMSELTRLLQSQGTDTATQAIQEALTQAGLTSQEFFQDQLKGATPFSAPVGTPAFVLEMLNKLGVAPAPVSQEVVEPASEQEDSSARGNGQRRGRFIDASYTNHAGSRSYKVYIPASYDGQPMPLLVMLHGCTQDPDDFARGTQMNVLAEEQGFLVVYPAQEANANAAKCWNWFNAIDQQRGQGEPSLIAGITNDVIEQYSVKRSEVFIAGLSAGGAMAVILGNTYPDLYRAVGVHSGLPYASASDLPSALQAMKAAVRGNRSSHSVAASSLASIPVIVFHGDGDTTVNPANGTGVIDDFVVSFRQADAATISTVVEDGSVDGGHRFSRTSLHADGLPVLAEHWLIHGAGHAWSGGSAQGTYTDEKGPDASREMLRFFSTQALRERTESGN